VDANAALRIVGFGFTEAGKKGTKVEARVIIASPSCTGKVRDAQGREVLDLAFYGCRENEIVAAGKIQRGGNWGVDTCKGDSGGPAFVAPAAQAYPGPVFEKAFESIDDKPPSYAVAAVTSWALKTASVRSTGNGDCGHGGRYTRLTGDALKWMQATAAKWGETITPVD
jgi:hypothetical protein